jgi:hypothetical protein
MPFDPKPMARLAASEELSKSSATRMPNPTPPSSRLPFCPSSKLVHAQIHSRSKAPQLFNSFGLTDLTLPETIMEEAFEGRPSTGHGMHQVLSHNSAVSLQDSLDQVMQTGQFSSVDS